MISESTSTFIKRVLASAIFLAMSFIGYSQEYQVLHIKGEIIRVIDGVQLKPGDKIDAEEKINFKSKDAMAAVLSSEKGRYILKADTKADEEGDLIYILKSTVSPVRGGMSTRAAGINNLMDLKVYFEEAPYVWAGDEIRLFISSNAFPMSEERFFYMQLEINGEKFNKRLEHNGNALLISKSKLFVIDDNPIDYYDIDKYGLYYYDSVNEESELISEIQFVLIDSETLNEIYAQYQDPSDDVFYSMADMFSDLYGKCDPLQLRFNILKK